MAFLLDRLFQKNEADSSESSGTCSGSVRVTRERERAETHMRTLLDAFGKAEDRG